MASKSRDLVTAASVAALQAPVPWTLILVAHQGLELVSGVLGLCVLLGCALAPMLLGRSYRSWVLLGLGGLAASLEIWGVATALRPHHTQGAAFWGVVAVCLWVPWALLVAGLWMERPRSAAPPVLALLLVLVIPASALVQATAPNPWGLTLSKLILAWRHPDEARMEQYLEWITAGDTVRLWEAGTESFRGPTCLENPAGCPDFSTFSPGTPVQTTFACSALEGHCTWVRRFRFEQRQRDATYFSDWSIQTDLEGRFHFAKRLWMYQQSRSWRLPPYPDTLAWLYILAYSGVTWVPLAAGLFLALRIPGGRKTYLVI